MDYRSLKSDFFIKGSQTVFVRFTGLAVSVLVSIILGRTLGPYGMGLLSISERISMILVTIVLFGAKNFLVKHVAIHKDVGNNNEIFEIVIDRIILSTIFFGIIFIIYLLIGERIVAGSFKDPNLIYPLAVFIVCVLFQSISEQVSSAMFGINSPLKATLLFGPLYAFFRLSLIAIMIIVGLSIDVNIVANIYLASFVIVSAYSIYLIREKFYENGLAYKPLFKRIFQSIEYSKSFMWISLILVISTGMDTIILGMMVETEEVGLYAIAARITLLINVLLSTVTSMLQPKIAVFINQGSIEKLERLLKRTNTMLWVISGLILLVLFLSGKFILSLWGDAFIQSYWMLIFLAIGQCINLMTGSVGSVLIMGGYEKTMIKISISMLLLNIALSYTLITVIGAVGAAIATAIVLSLENIIRAILVKKKFNISVIPSLNEFSKKT